MTAYDKRLADELLRAADLLVKDGWCQGYHQRADGARCVSRALDHAGNSLAARLAFTDYLGGSHKVSLWSWNDASNRTADEVISALRDCATRLMGESDANF